MCAFAQTTLAFVPLCFLQLRIVRERGTDNVLARKDYASVYDTTALHHLWCVQVRIVRERGTGKVLAVNNSCHWQLRDGHCMLSHTCLLAGAHRA